MKGEKNMKMKVAFDVDADIIDVPEEVIEKRFSYATKFRNWLYDPHSKHNYRVTEKDGNGEKFTYLCYRSDAFVEWLNRRILKKSVQKAVIVEQHVDRDGGDLPTVYF